ncbi:hypothetical protein FI667_g1972, partial [Globisporangium splendens]
MRTNQPDHVNARATDESETNEVDTTEPSGGDDAMTGRHETTPSPAEGSPKEASTETAPIERYEVLTAKMRGSLNAVNRVEIGYEVRLMFPALYNGIRTHRMRTLKGETINATCLSQLLSVLGRQDLSRQLEAWGTARLYFDGGARGNPGPGGSGRALIFLNERSDRWELKACGYA